MEELDIAVVTKRSIHGVFALVSRTFFIRLIGSITGLLLAGILSPSIFGVFYVVSAIIPFLSYFSDIGLAASLIQKKEAITETDLTTTFTIQQGLVISLVVLALLFSNAIGKFYNLEGIGIHLFQAVVIAFFLSSLKTIPSILLERKLEFGKLVVPELVETLSFNATVLFCAIYGLGIASFTYAVLIRGISGVITIYLIAPWKIRFGFSKQTALKLMSFGIPFQTNSILALLKDDLLVIYLGKVLPLSELGYIGFAQKIAFTPLRLIMDNIIRITFPSFARLQHDKQSLSTAIEKSLFAVSFFIFPSLFGIVVLTPYLIKIIPQYRQWEGALVSVVFFALNATLSSISTPLTNALNAIGKIKITLYLMVFWTIATWVITPIFVLLFGFNGVAAASALIACSVVIVIFITKKYVSFDIIKIIQYPLLAGSIMGVSLYVLSSMIIINLLTFIAMILFGVLMYVGFILLIARNLVIADLQLIIANLKR